MSFERAFKTASNDILYMEFLIHFDGISKSLYDHHYLHYDGPVHIFICRITVVNLKHLELYISL